MYGGPQDPAGYIHMFAMNFLMYRDVQNRHQYISFVVSETSYMRFFIALDPGKEKKKEKKRKEKKRRRNWKSGNESGLH